jgi:thiosulfate/3-mercaptopyruvate sulfurtransferase
VTSDVPALVSTDWLGSRLGSPGLRVVDGSWYLPGSGRDPAAEYASGHIPGAVFLDLDATSDSDTSLPHMLPSPDEFADRMMLLGLNQSDHIVVYDGSGVNLSAPRVWWMLRVLGHTRVSVLDGGIGKWLREHRPVETGVVRLPRGRFAARLNRTSVRDLSGIRANIQSRAEQLVDVRPAGRFAGVEPEPRPGLRAGHVPGSKNLPFNELVRADGTVLSPPELKRRIEAAGIELAQPIVATCGSGTSACALVLALHLLGQTAAVYDGAWTEWSGRSDTPVETGPSLEGS